MNQLQRQKKQISLLLKHLTKYSVGNKCLNNDDFKPWWNIPSDETDSTDDGKLFQTHTAETRNVRSPVIVRRVGRMTRGKGKGKGKGKREFVEHLVVNTPLKRSGMARVLKGSHSFTCTPRIHPLTEWTIPAFAFPAEAGTHFPTAEGWKAELALGGWLVEHSPMPQMAYMDILAT